MTIQAQVSVYSQVFVPREYDVFVGLDVDHHSTAATFTDHQRLMQSLRLPYSARQLTATRDGQEHHKRICIRSF